MCVKLYILVDTQQVLFSELSVFSFIDLLFFFLNPISFISALILLFPSFY